jgi:hypothetical protein
MTQQHVLYGIKVAEGERWRWNSEPCSRLFSGTHLTRGPFKITDHCVNDLGRGYLLACSGGIKDALYHYTTRSTAKN